MVSYYPISTMYHGQQATTWYPPGYRHHQPQQVYFQNYHQPTTNHDHRLYGIKKEESSQFLSCMHEMSDQPWVPNTHTHNHAHAHSPTHSHGHSPHSHGGGGAGGGHHAAAYAHHAAHAVAAAAMFPQDWAAAVAAGGQDEHILPSPPITEMSSPGPGMTPPSGLTASAPLQPQQPRPAPARSPYEWMKKPSYQSQPNPALKPCKKNDELPHKQHSASHRMHTGKTRTKDKYRVVYTDHQRLELEKEFHYSRYITIRRKAEMAATLGLSERQVKIWFQNRRAKDRKQVKKREELIHKEKIQQLALL